MYNKEKLDKYLSDLNLYCNVLIIFYALLFSFVFIFAYLILTKALFVFKLESSANTACLIMISALGLLTGIIIGYVKSLKNKVYIQSIWCLMQIEENTHTNVSEAPTIFQGLNREANQEMPSGSKK